MKMEILLEPTSNKLMVDDLCDSIRIKLVTTGKKRWCDSIRIKLVPEHAEFDESDTHVLQRFNTSAGNPVKEILLKLNLPDHRILKDGGEEESLVLNDQYPEQTIAIGRQLPTKTKIKLQELLRTNIDVFAWTPSHMKGVPRTIRLGGEAFITEHIVNELKHVELVKQKKRSMAPERNEAFRIQVEELTKANILREVKYQMWVSNHVIVKKANERWKLCVDFTDINKACPKEHYPLPAADQKVEDLFKLRKRKDGLMDNGSKRSLSKNERISRTTTNEHEIEFRGRSSIKEQILADFLTETPSMRYREILAEEAKRKEPEPESAWKLFTNGASSSDGFGAGLMLVIPKGKEYTYTLRFKFKTINNETEYEALLAGLRIAKEMKIQELTIFVDSQLVAN
ncbi:reverse transcriptase domain-containing protein [Tanacetum coccineum]